MKRIKEMANQMLAKLGKGVLSDYPSLEKELETINRLCGICKSPYTDTIGGLISRQVIASTIVCFFTENGKPS